MVAFEPLRQLADVIAGLKMIKNWDGTLSHSVEIDGYNALPNGGEAKIVLDGVKCSITIKEEK